MLTCPALVVSGRSAAAGD